MIHAADHNPRLSCVLPDEAATLRLGAQLAQTLTKRLVIHLCGDLGAGKTTLVRGVLRALGYGGKVKSPTYTLVELYAISRLNLHHFDFYRFSQPEEFLDAGLDEYFQGDCVSLVEWPERAGTFLAPPDLRITLDVRAAGRVAELEAHSEAGRTCIERMRELQEPGTSSGVTPQPGSGGDS